MRERTHGSSRGARRRWAPLPWLAPVVVAALACGPGEDPVAGRDFRDLPADQVMFDPQYDITDLGRLRARLQADTAYLWEDSAKTLMFPVDLLLYDENGNQTAHLTANEGELDTRSNRMVARGNVVLVTVNGERRILTEELHYDPQRGQIWSDVKTVMFAGESRVEGEGFRSDDEMRNLEITKGTGENLQFEF